MAKVALETEILQRLSARGGRCASLADLFAGCKCSGPQQHRLCQRLLQAGRLDFREEIVRFGLSVTGKTLLKLDTSVWPVTPDELLILRACVRGRMGPGQVPSRVPVDQRQALLHQLAAKKLIVVYQTAIVDIVLTVQDTHPSTFSPTNGMHD